MTVPLLATKLYMPSLRSDLVPRPRLIERLNEGLSSGRQLALVSAPAGYGKTTLLAEWLSALPPDSGGGSPRAGRVAWLSIDQEDNEPARFWTYLVAALRTAAEGVGESAREALQAPQPPSPQLLLTGLLNDIAALPQRIILVLDDFHLVTREEILEGLGFLVNHQPRQLHLVLSTRADPVLPLARLRARGRLTEVRLEDLAFTVQEAVTFFNDRMGLDLLLEDVRALETRTEGWVAGLQLAALSLQDCADRRGFITTFAGSHHFVLEYLAEEVLNRQPEPVQRFLRQTSILDRLCGPLCDAVYFGHAETHGGGGAMLSGLHRKNLFLVVLDDEHRWYRYHHLFADLLRRRFEREASGEQIVELYRRASAWH
ncbi:MAG: AAA family ATPase, partial [Anaerolineae bacterium]